MTESQPGQEEEEEEEAANILIELSMPIQGLGLLEVEDNEWWFPIHHPTYQLV